MTHLRGAQCLPPGVDEFTEHAVRTALGDLPQPAHHRQLCVGHSHVRLGGRSGGGGDVEGVRGQMSESKRWVMVEQQVMGRTLGKGVGRMERVKKTARIDVERGLGFW